MILSCAASLGKVAIAKKEIYTNQQFYGLVCNKEEIMPEFLAFQLFIFGENYYKNIGGTSTLTFFRKEIALNIPIIKPSIAKQKEFAHIVKNFEMLKEKQKQSEEKINHLYNNLMQKAFVGELIK